MQISIYREIFKTFKGVFDMAKLNKKNVVKQEKRVLRDDTTIEMIASCLATIGKTNAGVIARELNLPRKLVTDLLWQLEQKGLVQSFRKNKPFQPTTYRARVALARMYA